MIVIILLIVCFVLPLGVIVYDKMMYYKWYTQKPKLVFLRLNNEKVRNLLREEGFEICWCCFARGNVYLSVGSEGTIHGMGQSCEEGSLSLKEVVALEIHEAQQLGQIVVDCGTDVGKFIKEIKLIRKNNRV